MMMYLFTTVPHPHGHWQLQELLGNGCVIQTNVFWGDLTDISAKLQATFLFEQKHRLRHPKAYHS